MVGGTTSKEDQTPATSDGGDIVAKSSKDNLTSLKIDTTTHSVEDGLRLLVDFLEHVVGVSSLGDGVEFHLEGVDGK